MSGWYKDPEYRSYGLSANAPRVDSVLDAENMISAYRENPRKRAYKDLQYGIPIAPNTLLRVESEENARGETERCAIVRYWYTDVLRLWDDESYQIDFGGHENSPSTKARIKNTLGFCDAYGSSEKMQMCRTHSFAMEQVKGSHDVWCRCGDCCKDLLKEVFPHHPKISRVLIPFFGVRTNMPGSMQFKVGRFFHDGISLDELRSGAWIVDVEKISERWPSGTPVRMVALNDFANGCPGPVPGLLPRFQASCFVQRSGFPVDRDKDGRWVYHQKFRASVVDCSFFAKPIFDRTGYDIHTLALTEDFHDALKALAKGDAADNVLSEVLFRTMNSLAKL